MDGTIKASEIRLEAGDFRKRGEGSARSWHIPWRY